MAFLNKKGSTVIATEIQTDEFEVESATPVPQGLGVEDHHGRLVPMGVVLLEPEEGASSAERRS